MNPFDQKIENFNEVSTQFSDILRSTKSNSDFLVKKVKVNSLTKSFYLSLENLIVEKNFQSKIDLTFLKKLIYSDLDDVIADEEDVDIGRLIGKGGSSKVYFGNFRYCPCAVKAVNLSILNIKQLVSDSVFPSED